MKQSYPNIINYFRLAAYDLDASRSNSVWVVKSNNMCYTFIGRDVLVCGVASSFQPEEEEVLSMNSTEIVTRAREILYDFGHVYRTDNILDDNADITQACSYEGYGLKLEAYDLPAQVFEDHATGKLIPRIKKYMNKFYIYYKGTLMFDSERNVYKGGIWEEILDELYVKLPVLLQREADWRQKELHYNEFMRNCFLPLYERRIRKMIGRIKIGCKSESTGEINNCGAYIYADYYYVEMDNRQVLCMKKSGIRNYALLKYEEGEWERIMEDYLVVVKRREEQKDLDDGREFLRQLRKL